MELNLVEWLQATENRRADLESYGRSKLPFDIGERHVDMDKAIESTDDAGRLLADAESYLSHEKAQAMFDVLKDEDLSAKEREIAIKDRVRMTQRIVDGIKVTVRTLNNRIYAIMNANRSRL